ncbi:hypothetical protein HW555_001849 [Spodoptera exigua]|uniref:Peptidase A2 domain-containing protein n=1 Tax=Spodoptera exigua TaxID=7107 RepID=A0A835L8G0_SPOEX|nr:hypothetical protein HW555_001849 [Spodoptera exigua]
MASKSKYTARIASVLRWLGSAVLNISRQDRVQALLSRYDSLESKLTELYDAHQAILELGLESEVMDKINADIDQADDLADQIRQAVGTLKMSSLDERPPKVEEGASPALISRLPKLDLPHFGGDLSQWVAYNNLYESLVHSRRDLTPAQKLAYLLASLTGEAKGLVQHLDLVDGNYEIARDLLMRRYQNVRRLADSHVSAILDLPKNPMPQLLRTRLLNPLLIAVNGLKGLDLPVSSWSFILLHIVLGKLSHELRNRFELEHGGDSTTYLPPFDDLVSFLEDECRRVENVPQPKSIEVRTRVQPARIERRREGRIYNSTAMQQPSSRCMYCKEPGHGTPTCFKFGQLRWQARRNIARQRNWCYSCLGNHLASQCQIARPCAQCGGNHHLLLCGNRNGSPPPAASAPKAVATEDRIIGNINDQWTGRARFGLPQGCPNIPHLYRKKIPLRDTQCQFQSSTGGGTRVPPRVCHATVDQERRCGFGVPLHYMDWPRLDQPAQYASHASQVYVPPSANPSHQHWTPYAAHDTSVSVGSPSGEKVTARALLDSGAQGCIASTWLVERLRLRVAPGGNYIRGVGGVKVPGLVGQVALSFSPLQSSRPRIIVSAIVLRNVIGRHPVVQLPSRVVALTSGLSLADPEFHVPGPVDLLIGADVLGLLQLGSSKLLQSGGLVSVATDLGDIIMGPVLSPCPLQGEDDNLQVGLSLAESVQRFWEVEEPPSAPRQNPEHLECESFFQNNTGRLCSGRRGRILRLFLGSDGVPRVAEVLVGDSILKRAVADPVVRWLRASVAGTYEDNNVPLLYYTSS